DLAAEQETGDAHGGTRGKAPAGEIASIDFVHAIELVEVCHVDVDLHHVAEIELEIGKHPLQQLHGRPRFVGNVADGNAAMLGVVGQLPGKIDVLAAEYGMAVSTAKLGYVRVGGAGPGHLQPQ